MSTLISIAFIVLCNTLSLVAHEYSWVQRALEPTGHSLNPTIRDTQKITYFFTSLNGVTFPTM